LAITYRSKHLPKRDGELLLCSSVSQTGNTSDFKINKVSSSHCGVRAVDKGTMVTWINSGEECKYQNVR